MNTKIITNNKNNGKKIITKSNPFYQANKMKI